jgi:hypothetical protein
MYTYIYKCFTYIHPIIIKAIRNRPLSNFAEIGNLQKVQERVSIAGLTVVHWKGLLTQLALG